MMNENHEVESIWADGVPERVDTKDILSNNEINDIAIDYTAKFLITKGYKLNLNFPRKEAPQIMCKKDGTLYAIFVVGSVFPNNLWINDDVRLKIVEDSKKFNFVPLFANPALSSKDPAKAKVKLLLKGDVFNVHFMGLRKITEEAQAPNIPPNSSFWFER